MAPGSRAGSAVASSSMVTISLVQGIRAQIEESCDFLEKAPLTVKNTCTMMVSSRTITEDGLNSNLRVPLIDQFIKTF